MLVQVVFFDGEIEFSIKKRNIGKINKKFFVIDFCSRPLAVENAKWQGILMGHFI